MNIRNSTRYQIACWLIPLMLLFKGINAYTQPIPQDTLDRWMNSGNDTLKARALIMNSRKAIFIKPDSGEAIAQSAIELARKLNNKDLESRALISIGVSYGVRDNYETGLDYFLKALKLAEEIKDTAGIAAIVGNIGVIYKELQQHEKAIEYFDRSIAIEIACGRPNSVYVANALTNKANELPDIGDTAGAIATHMDAIRRSEELGLTRGVSRNYHNLGILYDGLKQPDSALMYLQKSLEIKIKDNDQEGIVSTSGALGHIYVEQGQFDKARKYCETGLKLAQQLRAKEHLKSCAVCLSHVYANDREFEDAYKMRVLVSKLEDSIYRESTVQKITEANMKFEMERQHLKDSLITVQHDIKNQELIARERLKSARRNAWIIGILVVLVFAGVVIYMLVRSNKIKQESNEIISEKNEELSMQNEEILAQRDEIERQNVNLLQKNAEIVESIVAAERIQKAFFTFEERYSNQLPAHFVLFKPLELVSGDFYWVHIDGPITYIAVADCTGHGVPGAFLSMLGASFLNEIANNFPGIEPGKFLDKLRDKIVKELDQRDEADSSKEGMDISLVKLDNQSNEVHYAGANNPLYVLRNGEKNEVEQYKAHREPIGFTMNPTPFENHVLTMEPGDQIYLFSDGFPDQFGGPKKKKFGYKRFRSLLLENGSLSMEEQLNRLKTGFEEWIREGQETQIDDVCVFGIRF